MKAPLLAAGAAALRSTGMIWLVNRTTGELVPRNLQQYAALNADQLNAYHVLITHQQAEAIGAGIRARS